jgi:prolyl 4-hydroxylase
VTALFAHIFQPFLFSATLLFRSSSLCQGDGTIHVHIISMLMLFSSMIILAAAGGTTGFTTTTSPPPLTSILLFTNRHVHYSSSSLFSSTQAQGYLDTLATNKEAEETYANNFWGVPRNENEIIDFVSEAVFNGVSHHDAASSALNDNVAPTIDQYLQRIEVISEDPPLVIMHGFLKPEHCDAIMNAVLGPKESDDNGQIAKNKLKRSTMGVDQDESNHRTSCTAWLHPEHCPEPLDVFSGRVSNLSGLPTKNFENLQVVRYQPGQEFQIHTDHMDSFNDMDCGGRLATCLLYLNDGNDETFTGGETLFHEFKRAVSPRKGSALFWWNTLERPGSKDYDKNMFLNVDMKLRHAGLPVLTGEKWICNKWLHPLPFSFGVKS